MNSIEKMKRNSVPILLILILINGFSAGFPFIFNFSCACLQAAETPQTVDKIKVVPRGFLKRGEMTALREFDFPGPVDEEGIEKTTSNILRTGRVSKVEVNWNVKDGKNILMFELTPQAYVKELRFRGAAAIDKGRLEAAIDLKKYKGVSDKTAEQAVVKIKEFYVNEGFPEPELSYEIEKTGEDGASSVTFIIKEKPLPSLEKFNYKYEGAPGWWNHLRLSLSLKLFRRRALQRGFNEETLKDLLRKYERRIRKSGYQNAVLSYAKLGEDEKEPDAVKVNLDIGRKIKIKIRNVGFFTERNIIKPWRDRNIELDEREEERLLRRTREVLQEKGYLEVKAHVEREETEEEITVEIVVDKGFRYYVESLKFKGNDNLTAEELKHAATLHPPKFFGIFKSRPSQEALGEAVQTLEGYYAGKGYPTASVEAENEFEDKTKTGVVFTINEGPQRILGIIDYVGAVVFSREELVRISGLGEGDLYIKSAIKESVGKLQKAYWERGYTDVKLKVSLTQPEPTRANIKFDIAEGNRYVLGTTIVQDNFKTRSSLIYDAESIEEGGAFHYEPVAELQQQLYDFDIFDWVSIKTVDQTEENPVKKDVIIEVLESKTGYFQGGFDINTDQGFELTGQAGDRNLFGRAVDLSVHGLAGRLRSNISGKLSQPFFFGMRLHNFVRLYYSDDRTNEGFNLSVFGAGAGISRKFKKNLHTSLTYLYERETAFDVDPATADELDFDSGSVASITPDAAWDTRDDPFVTTKGLYLSSRLKISHDVLGAQLNFYRWETDNRWFHTFNDFFTVAAAFRGGKIWVTGGDIALPIGERFFLGGASTNRGFGYKELGPKSEKNDPLGGVSFLLTNLELRFPVWRILHGGIFVDAGNNYFHNPEPPYLRPSAGLGIRIQTPLGPLRGDIGFNLDRRNQEDSFALHFAIGHAF